MHFWLESAAAVEVNYTEHNPRSVKAGCGRQILQNIGPQRPRWPKAAGATFTATAGDAHAPVAMSVRLKQIHLTAVRKSGFVFLSTFLYTKKQDTDRCFICYAYSPFTPTKAVLLLRKQQKQSVIGHDFNGQANIFKLLLVAQNYFKNFGVLKIDGQGFKCVLCECFVLCLLPKKTSTLDGQVWTWD